MTNNTTSYKVSVIVPVFNAEKFIGKCLDSLVQQTLKDIEIIVINDGSTDNSINILKKYVKRFNNLKLYTQSNHGLYYTRKIGLHYATGKYIGWVDADDFIEPNMYEVLYTLAEEKSADVAYCDYNFYPRKTKTKEKWFRQFKGKKDIDFIERNSQLWNKIVKRKVLKNLKISDIFETCFDEAYIKVLLHAKTIAFTDEKLYHYRISDSTMSSSYANVAHYKNFIQASVNLKEEMEFLCKNDEYWKHYFDFRISYYKLIAMIVAANARDFSTYKTLKKESKKIRDNKHFSKIMQTNYGFIKSFVMSRIIPINFSLARIMCRFVFT